MVDKELLEAIRQIVKNETRQAVQEELKPINQRLNGMQEDFDILKENSAEVRAGVNQLLGWAEEASVEVKVPLFKKAQ